jgi:hypothetical protein
MAPDDKTTGMKSAYDLALERLEQQGIERPRDEGLSPETRDRIGELRNQSEAKLAELEILYRDSLKTIADPDSRARAEEEYADERRRVEERRDRDIERLRSQS